MYAAECVVFSWTGAETKVVGEFCRTDQLYVYILSESGEFCTEYASWRREREEGVCVSWAGRGLAKTT